VNLGTKKRAEAEGSLRSRPRFARTGLRSFLRPSEARYARNMCGEKEFTGDGVFKKIILKLTKKIFFKGRNSAQTGHIGKIPKAKMFSASRRTRISCL
jgi:hypothetical protein